MIPLNRNPLYALSMAIYDHCVANAASKVALDIGANEGGYTQSLVEKGYHVTAFEPVPDVYERLLARFRDNPSVVPFNMGVSDRIGLLKDVTVLCAWTLGTPETVPLSVCPSYVNSKPFNVFLVTVDTFCWPKPIGIIKLDVDGYEMKVLRGARHTIDKFRPPILCEFSEYIGKIGDNPEDFVNHIFNMGYHVFSMDGKRRFRHWREIEPCYPFTSSFDVMLIPTEMSNDILNHFNGR